MGKSLGDDGIGIGWYLDQDQAGNVPVRGGNLTKLRKTRDFLDHQVDDDDDDDAHYWKIEEEYMPGAKLYIDIVFEDTEKDVARSVVAKRNGEFGLTNRCGGGVR